jgi:hypothetical protein
MMNSLPLSTPVVLRPATPDDANAIARLAALDSSTPPALPVLVADSGGALTAALSLTSGQVVANPFAPTADHVLLLKACAQLHAGRRFG